MISENDQLIDNLIAEANIDEIDQMPKTSIDSFKNELSMHNDQNLIPTRTSIYSKKSEEDKIAENDQDQVKNEDDE